MDRTIDTSRTLTIDGKTSGTVLRIVLVIIALVVSGILTLFLLLLLSYVVPIAMLSIVLTGSFAFTTFFGLRDIVECGRFLKTSSNVLTISPDTRPWITFTIDLWRLNINAGTLYDICQASCQAYASAARAKHAG